MKITADKKGDFPSLPGQGEKNNAPVVLPQKLNSKLEPSSKDVNQNVKK